MPPPLSAMTACRCKPGATSHRIPSRTVVPPSECAGSSAASPAAICGSAIPLMPRNCSASALFQLVAIAYQSTRAAAVGGVRRVRPRIVGLRCANPTHSTVALQRRATVARWRYPGWSRRRISPRTASTRAIPPTPTRSRRGPFPDALAFRSGCRSLRCTASTGRAGGG